MVFSRISRVWLVLAACVMTLFSATLLAQGAPGGKKYMELSPAQPTEPGKVEALEFFSYSCPHCAVLEPLLEKWIKGLPADVIVKRVPVAFNASMKPLQQLYYSLEAMDRMDLHPKAFQAIHEEKKRLFTKADIIAWAVAQGIDRAKFETLFDSFGVMSKVSRADQLVNAYKIQGTPSVAVAGRYVVSPSEAGGYQETIDQADALVKQIRAAK
ncbi:MAG: thiol:disulfide interchange protein DsbA/DsbL [Burkholderiaceae bacterium]|nr:thiol:disulfide interchange protein DsbA/DsbL [Burkholderiaceae bacterium]